MSWHRFSQAVLWLVAATAVLLVVLYAFTPGSDHDQPSPVADGPTPYPSIVLFPTLVPTPASDREPHVLDLSSWQLKTVRMRAGYVVRAMLSDGSLLSESGQGPATVFRPDGRVIADLPVPMYAPAELSIDHRYVAWIAADNIQVYDAEAAQTSSAPPQDAHFDGSLSDGGVLMSDATGAWPSSPRNAQAGEETVIVDSHGAVTDRLPISRWIVRVSSDGGRIAWVANDGLHVYDRAMRSERVYPDVRWVTGEIAWSTDAAEIAYLTLTGDNRVHVVVIDITSGQQHQVYSAQPEARIQRMSFAANHELQLQIAPINSPAAQYDLPGARYVVADDGSGGRFLDDPATLWSDCGSPCGMPPAGYEGVDGLARWCERFPGGGACTFHLAFVDRGAGVARELAAGDFAAWSFSPDGQQLAILIFAGTDQVLRVVRLDDFTSRDFPLGFTYANNVGWFPDGRSLLLWTSGGN